MHLINFFISHFLWHVEFQSQHIIYLALLKMRMLFDLMSIQFFNKCRLLLEVTLESWLNVGTFSVSHQSVLELNTSVLALRQLCMFRTDPKYLTMPVVYHNDHCKGTQPEITLFM
jgi:hypothetical protein